MDAIGLWLWAAVGAGTETIEAAVASAHPDSEIEQIYPLTPMQEGMLFHALLDPDSTAYFEQMSITLTGELEIDELCGKFPQAGCTS